MAGAGFWLVEARYYVKRDEVSDMILKETPYKEDSKLIFESLKQLAEHDKEILKGMKDDNRDLMNAVQKNMEAITALKIELATMGR